MKDLDSRIKESAVQLKDAPPNLSFYEYMAKGKAAYKLGRYDEAISHFTEANLSKKDSESNLYLARSHQKLLSRLADTVAYKERALSSIRFYNEFLRSGDATNSNYEEVIDLLQSLDQKQFNFDTLDEALKVCESGTKIFFEPNSLHVRLFNLSVNLGYPDQAEKTLEHVARHGNIEFILDKFEDLLLFEFDDENKPNTMLNILTDRIYHDDTIDRGHMASCIAKYYRDDETDTPHEREFNRAMAIKFFKHAYDIDSVKYHEAREEMEIIFIDGIERPLSKKTKKKYENLLTNFYKEHPDIKPAKLLQGSLPKANSVITAVENRPNPMEIAALLSQYVVGQEKAIEKFAVLGSEHMKRIQAKFKNIPIDDIPKKKLLLVHGPPGCGKTYTGQTLAKILGVPVLEYNASDLTESGYVGAKSEDIFEQLVKEANGNIQDAQHGIVLLDEFDKLASKDSPQGRDVSGSGAQKPLLKIVEGTNVKIFDRTKYETMFDTTYVSFILMGSFAGLDNNHSDISTLDRIVYYGRYGGKKAIGFGVESRITESGAAKLAEPEDFVEFGILPEIIDRTSLFTYYQHLSQKELRRILTEPKDSIVKSYIKSFEMDNIELTFTNESLNLIAETAYQMKGSARSLAKVMGKIMLPLEFTLPSQNVKEYKMTLDKVRKLLEQD